MVKFTCPVCKENLSAPTDQIGTKSSCPNCGQRLQIPNPAVNKTILGELPSQPSIASQSVKSDPPRRLPPPIPPNEDISVIEVICEACRQRSTIPETLENLELPCPHCGKITSMVRSRPAERSRRIPSREKDQSDFDFDGPDEDSRYDTYARRSRESDAAKTCSVLSIVCGCVAFLLCPPLFGLAGLILGIIGVVLSRDKSLGIIGIVVSVIGTIVGMIVGAALMGLLRPF